MPLPNKMFGLKYLCPLIVFTAVLSLSCSSTPDKGKTFAERSIYTNENIVVHGKAAGVSENLKRVYPSLFADFLGDLDLQRRFDESLKLSLSRLGLITVDRIWDAEAVLTGSLDSLVISDAVRATNIPGLIYTLEGRYKVTDRDGKQILQNQSMWEEVLVLDTNTFDSNAVVEVLIQEAARHTAEGVFYGWQLDYTKTDRKVKILEALHDTDHGTNRSK